MTNLSKSEAAVARSLHDLGSEPLEIGYDAIFQELDEALSPFLLECLREKYPELKGEGIEGFTILFGPVIEGDEYALIGNCRLTSDGAIAAIYAKIRSSNPDQGVDRIDCRLGEIDEQTGEMKLVDPELKPQPFIAFNQVDDIRWKYHYFQERH